MSSCSNCARLEGRITALEAENAVLKDQLKAYKAMVECALSFCVSVIKSVTREKAKGNVPRPRWTFISGQEDVAVKVANCLGYDSDSEPKPVKWRGFREFLR
jgi:hypothetical protein